MVRRLNDLTVVMEEPIAERSSETRFIKKYGREVIPKENLEILKQFPVLLAEAYGEFSMLQRHLIPEEANALLIGQKHILKSGVIVEIKGKPSTERINTLEIYSANYCILKKESG